MIRTDSKPGKFHLSVGSALAGLILFGGLQSFVFACRDPLARAIMRLVGRFIHSNALKIRERPTDWIYIVGSVAFGLIFVIAAIIIGAVILRRKTNHAI
jgi:hypothetical protein